MGDDGSYKRSNSRSRTPHPTTPLRPSSRSSFRDSARAGAQNDASFPLNIFEPHFAEFSDAMADLEANLMHFQIMHESLARFSESFASFMYGLNMNAFCVDFPEGPIAESFSKPKDTQAQTIPFPDTPRIAKRKTPEPDDDVTFMTPGGDTISQTMSSKASKISTSELPSKSLGRGLSSTSSASRGRGPMTGRGTTSTRGGSTRGTTRGMAKTSSRGVTRGSGLQAPRARGLR
ncbi:DASH complex subunit DAM1 [Ceratocystis lukuohia]|uniref:DASH complex subunit DAM1 n=2 Tax=Ceratocystis TaxID=5157 RepID=A0A2C5XNW3_9PEZI|nr:DASH complex subunit DAM1 [Ceratocystis fimbriata CBS 114723]